MEIVLKNTKSKYLEIFSLLDLDNIHETFKRFSSIKEPLEAKIFAVNESISSHQLLKLKNHFDKINICSLCIYSNNRNTIVSGKSLKIDSAYINEHEIKNKVELNIKKILKKINLRNNTNIYILDKTPKGPAITVYNILDKLKGIDPCVIINPDQVIDYNLPKKINKKIFNKRYKI